MRSYRVYVKIHNSVAKVKGDKCAFFIKKWFLPGNTHLCLKLKIAEEMDVSPFTTSFLNLPTERLIFSILEENSAVFFWSIQYM